MNRFQRVIQILDDAIGGPNKTIRAHGPFWRGLTRDRFVAEKVFDLDLVAVGMGADSNLVKALRGVDPFDGGEFPRMPAGRPPVPEEAIAFIERWIDEGCLEDPLPSTDTLAWSATNAPMADQNRGKRYDDVFFVTPDLGWGVNSDGKILRTTDAGVNWQEQFHSARTYFRCVAFASETRGWAGTLSGPARLLETSDGGTTWTAVTDLPENGPEMICGLSVVSESVVYASGTNYPFPFEENPRPAMMKTVDGGATWTGWDMTPLSVLLVDTFFTSPERGWVVGGHRPDSTVPAGNDGRDNVKPVVLQTEDSGKTWVNRVANLQDGFSFGEWGWKIQFLDNRIGFVSLENFNDGAILKTTDGGKSWDRLEINDSQQNADLEGVGFADENRGWVGGWGKPAFVGGQSSETSDGGRTWRDANEVGKFINRFRFFGSPVTVGYAAGATVYKYSAEPVPPPPTLAAALSPRLLGSDEPSEDTRLVRIPITVPDGASHLIVNVWERFGRHARELLDEAAPTPGSRTIEWDGTNDAGQPLRPGSYILRVTVDDNSESEIVSLAD